MLLGLIFIVSSFVSGCSDQDAETKKGENQSAELSGSITIAGSTSVQPFSEVLGAKFHEKYPEVQVNVQGGGSSQGVTAAASGAADIGAASRDLKETEKDKGLVVTKIALDGVAIIVNPANAEVNDLTVEQVRNIYLGNITNWQEVGGKDAAITVVCREEGSGTRDCFADKVMDKQDITDQAIIQNSNGAVRTTVAGDENAIGFVSLAIVNDEVKALKIEGVEASLDNIKNGNYKIFRNFNYLTKGEPEGLVKEYIDFVLSDEGQSIIEEEGAISIR